MASINSLVQQTSLTPDKQPISPIMKPAGASLPTKTAADLYGYGDMSRCSSSSPISLSRLMSSRKSLSAVRSAFALDMDKRKRRKVSFGVLEAPTETDYGYGDAAPEPPTKRRRYQRRNSKTPQMLMQMNSTLLNFDFSSLDDESEKKDGENKADEWDGGLEIAEELVKHLQNRRKKLPVAKTA